MIRGLHGLRASLLGGLLLLAGGSPSPAATERPLSEPARWLRHYLLIDTTEPRGEARAASYLADLLHREGITTQLLVSPEGRTSLYARLEAEDPRSGPVVLMHHLDVVPPGPGWSADPFGAEVREGRLWGRGALDIKSLGIAHLTAMLDLARRNAPLARDVIYLAVADEERGGVQGAGWILERHADLFEGAVAVLGEGGANRAVNGRHLWSGIEVVQKRPLWLRVESRGRGGHGSGLNPSSAVHRLIDALDGALALELEYRVTDAARQYLEALAPLHNEKYRRIFTNLDETIQKDGPTVSLLPGLLNLFLDTFQVTVLRGSEKINVIPELASARVDVRLLPDTDADAYLERLRDAMGPKVTAEVLLTSPPAAPSPVDHPIFQAVASVLAETAPPVPAFIPGFTDSRYFRERGIPAYGVSPFFLEPQDFLGIHGTDESIPLAELDRGVDRMKRIVAACVSEGGLATGARKP